MDLKEFPLTVYLNNIEELHIGSPIDNNEVFFMKNKNKWGKFKDLVPRSLRQQRPDNGP